MKINLEASCLFSKFSLAAGQVEAPTPLSGSAVPAVALPQGAQMTRQARRLYCGNLPFGITEVRNSYLIVSRSIWRNRDAHSFVGWCHSRNCIATGSSNDHASQTVVLWEFTLWYYWGMIVYFWSAHAEVCCFGESCDSVLWSNVPTSYMCSSLTSSDFCG